MSKKRHTVETIITKLREAEVLAAKGEQVPEICRQIGVTEPTRCRRRFPRNQNPPVLLFRNWR